VCFNQFPISENTLRLWDASTLETLHPQPLPSDVPNSPSLSVQPISWIPEEWPSNVDDLGHGGFAKQPPLIGSSPEISLIPDRSDLEDDEDNQAQPPQLLRFSGRKRKFVECDGDLDVARDVPSSKRICLEVPTTIAMVERSPVSRDHSSSDASLENQSPSSSLQCHEIELSLPESLTTSLAASSSHAPFPNYSISDSRQQAAGSPAPFDPDVDNILDSSSDSGLTSDDSSCGSWAYLETNSPSGTFVTLQDELFQIPNHDISNPSFILDLSSDVEIDLTRHHQLERSRRSFEERETIFDKYKRKRLFIANEDDYGGRLCKRRSIEQ
jgi:hypothetical protein